MAWARAKPPTTAAIAATAAGRLMRLLFDVAAPKPLPAISGNVLRGMLHPDGFRAAIVNWDQAAATLLRRCRAEVLAAGQPSDGVALLEEVSGYPGIPEGWRRCADMDWRLPMLTVQIRKGPVAFGLFSTLTSLGAPFDVTVQEIRIESFFPACAGARAFFEG